jgi:hypothetical protein
MNWKNYHYWKHGLLVTLSENFLRHGRTFQKYSTDKGILCVPHDHCPVCWDVWDFKLEQPKCPKCDTKLGEKCKIFIEKNICPHCEKGHVTPKKPKCKECDTEFSTDVAVWLDSFKPFTQLSIQPSKLCFLVFLYFLRWCFVRINRNN